MWPLAAAAQSLEARLEATQLRISAPSFHFIAGEALTRLQNGASVTFTFQLGTRRERTGASRDLITTRFIVSYDLWEEKYAVSRPGAERLSVTHLSRAAAEKWCMDHLSVSTAGIAEQTPFWITLSYQLEESESSSTSNNSTLNLGALIDIFSQKEDRQRSSGSREITGGPFRLSDLRKKR
jgi:hypothetical protein